MTKIRTDTMRRALLGEAIVTHLKAGPLTTSQVAGHFTANPTTIYGILQTLENDHRVHRLRTPSHRGAIKKWAFGPNPNEEIIDDAVAYLPKRPVLKSYPLNHVRDPLVALLFGQPEACHG